jgi:hypothetical protein
MMFRAAAPHVVEVTLSTRRIVWVDSNEFCGFACAACSWRFAIPGLRNSDGLPVEVARSGFDGHNCADYCITTATLIGALEEAIGKLANVVHRCNGDEQRTVLLQPITALQSLAADCDEVRASLSRLLEGVTPK